MWFTQGNLYTKVSRATEEEVTWLRSKESGLTLTNRSAIFRSGGDGKVELFRFFDLLDSVFPAGFQPVVARAAQEAGFKVEVIDGRQRPAVPRTLVPGPVAEAVARLQGVGWLHDYQLEAVAACLKHERGIVQATTGAGKTEVAIGLVKQVPCRWLFLVHRKTLMEQAAARYEERCPGEQAGRIGEGRWTVGASFTVATFQTLSSALKKDPDKARAFLAQFTGLLVDECHVLPAESFQRVSMALANAYWRVGISGTPLDREDQRSVYAVAALGPVIYKIGAQRLIAEGRIARPIIRMVSVHQEFVEKDADGLVKKWDWAKVYRVGVYASKLRNRALLTATGKAEKPALVFVKDIAHGKAFARALAGRGLKADFVWGSASLQTRQAAVKHLVRGDLDVLVSSVIFQEGVDIPELRSVVIASGGKGVIAALQRIGRGTRVTTDKTTFEVWDVADTGNAWLERHADARRRAYQREGYSISVVSSTDTGKVPGQATAATGSLPFRFR